MIYLVGDEPCLGSLENRENLMNLNALCQMKAMMHKWQHLTGAGVEHNHLPGRFRRMPLWYRVERGAASLPILRSSLR